MIKCTILLDKKGFRIFFENLGSTDDGRESSEQIIYFKMKILDLDATTCIELILFFIVQSSNFTVLCFPRESKPLCVCVFVCVHQTLYSVHCRVVVIKVRKGVIY